MRHSHPGRLLPAVVDTYPLDVSVYGVRGLGGNVTDWCADLFVKEGSGIERGRVITPELQEPDHVDLSLGSRRVNRGGNWLGFARGARCASRWDYEPSARGADLGVRLSRSFPSSL